MTEAKFENTLDRNPDLVVAAVYERVVEASLERVWENVYDWEHLPWLHSEAFKSIEAVASGDWGWRARVELAGSAKTEIELIANRDAGHYVARTIAGAGASTEIWTSVDSVAADQTAIQVEFCVRPMPDEALRKLGKGFVSLYTLLWTQDEGMMQGRESALAERRADSAKRLDPPRFALGRLEEVRARLPLFVDFAGRGFRVVELDGELVAHATQCPHRLGPLEACEIEDGVIVCPWHGYRFEVRTGKSAEGRSLRLPSAPRVIVDSATAEVHLAELAAEHGTLPDATRSQGEG